jgi:DNA topoisomerase III
MIILQTNLEPARYKDFDALMTTLVVAEKPSVARDIAAVLGALQRKQGSIEGNGYVITWAIGHLVGLAEPHQMNPAWKQWSMARLPMLPSTWPLVVSESTGEQFEVVKKLLRSRAIKDVVCATDAGREGELIFRYVYEASESKKPVRRLWISSLTPEAIRAGFRALRPGSEFNGLADAARARGRADWLVGMNLSRAYSLVHDDHLSVGRVQTPTLAMIVARDLEISSFAPEHYLEVSVTFGPPQTQAQKRDPSSEYEGRYSAPSIAGKGCRPMAKLRTRFSRAQKRALRPSSASNAKRGRFRRRSFMIFQNFSATRIAFLDSPRNERLAFCKTSTSATSSLATRVPTVGTCLQTLSKHYRRCLR